MKTLTLIQGSDAWHSHRATAYNASDAPAMLGISKYKTRSQLLKERATGIIPEVDDATQSRFNDGHRFEALARPLAEQIIGETLSPVTGTNGIYSASFDGITFDESTIFEHKILNADIRLAMGTNGNTGGLAEMYRVQMEHQLLVSDADKCLFMASKWEGTDDVTDYFIILDDGGRLYYNLTEEVHGWYLPDLVLRDRIIAGWAQLEKDEANYQHVAEVAAPVAEAIMGLPAVSIQATGMITASNLPAFKQAAETFIANIKTELVTDEDFSNAEANVKFCKAAEDDLEGTKKAILAQTTTIDEAIKVIDYIKGQLAGKRLMLDKLVKSEKLARKEAIAATARKKHGDHLVALESEIKPIRIYIANMPDFGGVMAGMKKLSAMQEAVDTALRNSMFELDTTATDYRAKLAWRKENADGQSALFPDLQNLMLKPLEDFALTITSRIEKQKADEAARLEAERARIQAQEEAKAQAKAKAEQDVIIAKVQAEERAKVEAEVKAKRENDILAAAVIAKSQEEEVAKSETQQNDLESRRKAAQLAESASAKVAPPILKPSNGRIIEAVMHRFNCSHALASDWILECAKNMRNEK